jgi:hypothetical protein
MKRSVAVVILICFVMNCVPYAGKREPDHQRQDPIVVSERVGDVIDPDEREYFDLFHPEIYIRPLTYQYISATVTPIYHGGYAVHISTTQGILYIENNDPRGLEIFADYMDNYEVIGETREIFEEKWDIIDYDDMGLPITKHERDKVWHEITTGQMALRGPSKIGYGLFIGGCLGGILAYGLIKALGLGSVEDETAPWSDAALILEWLGILAIGAAGLIAGGVTGAVLGATSSTVPATTGSEYDHETALIAIKEQRRPVLLEKE